MPKELQRRPGTSEAVRPTCRGAGAGEPAPMLGILRPSGPSWQHDGLGLQGGADRLRQAARAHDDLEDVLVEPGVAHRVKALVPELVTPGVLHPPAPWDAVDQVDTGQAHGVRERRLARHQPLGLRHRQLHPVQALVVVQGGVPDPGLLVPLPGDVAGEPHRLAVLDRGDRGGLEHLELGGDVVLDRFAHHDVAAPHAVARVDRDLGARVVGQDHELLHPGGVALRELSRSERPDPVKLLVLIAVLPHELLGRGPRWMHSIR